MGFVESASNIAFSLPSSIVGVALLPLKASRIKTVTGLGSIHNRFQVARNVFGSGRPFSRVTEKRSPLSTSDTVAFDVALVLMPTKSYSLFPSANVVIDVDRPSLGLLEENPLQNGSPRRRVNLGFMTRRPTS